MKLSDNTVTVLKNFASINPNFKTKGGNVIHTISGAKNVLAKATISEQFPSPFAIYDLGALLSVINLYDDPELNVLETELVISNDKGMTTHYSLCSESLFQVKEINKVPPAVVDVTIKKDQFEQISKFAAALSAADITFVGKKGKNIKIVIADKANPASHKQEFTLPDTADADFKFFLKVSNLNLLPGDYTVSFAEKAISRFKNNNMEVEYFIALEADSTYSN